ncbi:MAG: PAS domain S-box protein [Pyrinomonadaceae bacterium]
MFRSRLFWKFYGNFVLVILLTAVTSGGLFLLRFERHELRLIFVFGVAIGIGVALLAGLNFARQVVGPFGWIKELGNLTAINIAERRQAEEENLETEEYRNLFRLANDSIIIFEPVDEAVLVVLDNGCKTYGLRRDDFIGRSLKQLSFDAPAREQELKKLLDAGTHHEFETVQLRADGTPIHFLINSSVIKFHGRLAVLSINRDITERKLAEEKIKRSEEWLRAILSASRDGILVEDDGAIVYVNNAYAHLLGYEPDELIGRHIVDILPLDHAERMTEYSKRRLRGETPPSVYEFQAKHKDGTLVEVEASVSTSVVGGKKYITTAIRDMAERKRAKVQRLHLEEQLRQSQKMEAVGQLAGGIAHDFNNLLTVINGYSDMLLMRAPAADPSRGKLTEIRKAGDRAADLTRQLLAFSRKQILQPRVIDLNDIVADMGKMLRRVIGENIDLVTVRKPYTCRVNADPGQIEQMVMNLIVNARDAMPQGGRITVEIKSVALTDEYAQTHPDVMPGRYVMLAVSDTGAGIDTNVQARIFEPFFTTKDQGKGTGLGLSTVHGIVKQSGGHVWVYSEMGVGSTFKVYLPGVAEGNAPEAKETASPARRARARKPFCWSKMRNRFAAWRGDSGNLRLPRARSGGRRRGP